MEKQDVLFAKSCYDYSVQCNTIIIDISFVEKLKEEKDGRKFN